MQLSLYAYIGVKSVCFNKETKITLDNICKYTLALQTHKMMQGENLKSLIAVLFQLPLYAYAKKKTYI